MNKHRRSWLTAMTVLCVSTGLAIGETAIKVSKAYRGDGSVIENAIVLVADGKIKAIGSGIDISGDAEVIELPDTILTPGLIDAMCVLDFEVTQSASRGRMFRTAAEAKSTNLPEAICRVHDTTAVDTDLSGPSGYWAGVAIAAEEEDPNHLECVCAGEQPHNVEQFTPLYSAIRPRATWAEHSSEVVPHYSVIDAVNLWSKDFAQLAREGVTTVFVSPDSASVIGSRGAVVKTAGKVRDRIVRDEDAVKATMGGDPARRGRSNMQPFGGRASIHTRRPTTRMGVDWVFRKAFYDARRSAAGLPIGGADTPPQAAIPILNEIMAGKVPLRIQARMQHDIYSAVRVAKEFGLRFLLEEATEAYQCMDLLKETELSLVYGPMYLDATGFRRFNGEADDSRLGTPKRLHESGIPFALTAQEFRGEDGLARQAMLAVRYGLPKAAACASVTSMPAKLMGLEKRIGDLRSGLDADLVLWRGEPFSAEGRPVLVMINGQVVYQEEK